MHAAQETEVSWGGEDIGMLTGFTVKAGKTSIIDVTPSNTTVVGSGEYTRCLRKVGVGSIEPATLSITLYSGPKSGEFTQADRGDVKELKISGKWGGYTGQAILLDYSISGRVGEPVTISAEFMLEGG